VALPILKQLGIVLGIVKNGVARDIRWSSPVRHATVKRELTPLVTHCWISRNSIQLSIIWLDWVVILCDQLKLVKDVPRSSKP
jgi:hypothetical protein